MPSVVISGDSSDGIYRSTRELIENGRLKPGDALPPLRELAQKLSVNRNTVGVAYRRLAFDGYILTNRRRGTIVADNGIASYLSTASPPGPRNLSDGNPDPALLPDMGDAFTHAFRRKHLYGEFVELPKLVETAPIFFSRPKMRPDQVAIVGGAMDGLERILTACLKPGDQVIVEDPCFASALNLVRALGLSPIPVQVDQNGVLPASLERALRGNAKAVLLTPIAHNPTGATMTADRLDRIIHCLNKHEDVLVIEDDHFGPLCTDALPANYGTHGRNWIAICSVSKFLGPDMRLGVLFGDPSVVRLVRARQRLGARWVSHLLQGATLHFLLDPKMKKSLAHAGAVYAERRRMAKGHLEKLGFSPISGVGLNMWVPMTSPKDLAQLLSTQGWIVRSGEAFTIEAAPGLRLSTGCLDAGTAEQFAHALEACLSQTERSLTA